MRNAFAVAILVELEQKDAKVEGVLHAMGQRILLAGTYVDKKWIGERFKKP